MHKIINKLSSDVVQLWKESTEAIMPVDGVIATLYYYEVHFKGQTTLKIYQKYHTKF